MSAITIGIATYNREKLLKRAVKSVINQSFQNFKIIIGNDYTEKKILKKNIGINDPRIKIFNHKKNLGERKNMNFLLNKSNSKWFTWLADDDFFEPKFFEKLFSCLKKYKKTNVVASYSNYKRMEKKKYKKIKKKIIVDPLIFDQINFLTNYSCKRLRLIGTYGIIKTKILKKIQKNSKFGRPITYQNKNTGIYPYTDFIIPIQLTKYGKIVWLNERLINLDISNQSISKHTKDYQSYLISQKEVLSILEKILNPIKEIKKKKKILFNVFDFFIFNQTTILQRLKNKNIVQILFLYLLNSFKLIRSFDFDLKILLFFRILNTAFKHIIKPKIGIFYK